MNYRIVEQEYRDGSVKYILEKEKLVDGQLIWDSVFRSPDLEEVRKAKEDRLAFETRSRRVIE